VGLFFWFFNDISLFYEFGSIETLDNNDSNSRQVGKRAISFVKLNDKMSFTAMIINIMVTAYLLGAAPSYFYLIWSVKGLLFFPSMYLKFKKAGWQLFFYDFCYMINLLCYVYCWIYPNSTHFFHMLFVDA